MKHSRYFTFVLVPVVAVLAAAGCTMSNSEPPAFSGPSEFGTSITVTITPDVITQDGASQSVVTVTARGPNSEPLANLPLRAQIVVNGTVVDFGTLSARSIVTDANGRATLIYTAPPSVGGIDDFTTVDIAVTPIGSDFSNSVARRASLRVIPRGTVIPPSNVELQISVTPEQPEDNQSALFRATVCAARSNPQDPCVAPTTSIVNYSWDFGDGSTGIGPVVSHAFPRPGTFVVRLIATDSIGRVATTSTSVSVTAGTGPTAVFSFSPTTPFSTEPVFFNASGSTPAAGRRIVSYRWVFGDGGTSSEGPTTSHVYANPGTYNVTLTVTDDAGRIQTSTPQAVTVVRRP